MRISINLIFKFHLEDYFQAETMEAGGEPNHTD